MINTIEWDFLNDPFFLGFQPNVKTWNNTYSTKPSYPPYNLIKKDDDSYVIELALAGFDKSDLEITIDKNMLTIKGEKENKDTEYAYQGIANRSFERSFALGEYMEVTSAGLDNGMLSITVERIIPEDQKPKSIKIK